MGWRKASANFQLLADNQLVTFTDHSQTIDSARRSPRQWHQILNATQIHAKFRADQIAQFFARVVNFPAEEIPCLLIKLWEHSRKQFCTGRVTISRRTRPYPLFHAAGNRA